jgi:hypothetical protein
MNLSSCDIAFFISAEHEDAARQLGLKYLKNTNVSRVKRTSSPFQSIKEEEAFLIALNSL